MKRLCRHTGCNVLIDYNKVYCPKHEAMHVKQKHEGYRIYDKHRLDIDKDVVEFYKTQDWLRVRNDVRRQLFHMDLYEYYRTGRIIEGFTVHHIIPLRDAWTMRLDRHNLIYLSDSNHKHMHRQYDTSEKIKEETELLLISYLKKFHDEFLHI
ncbi:HNH endonuclease [Clostridium neuense]|uniref:HNH endonuclease n=1 Tax=Clostridium neuense TaxID=1728934 RepID=A0ABW8TJY3_9CLOT